MRNTQVVMVTAVVLVLGLVGFSRAQTTQSPQSDQSVQTPPSEAPGSQPADEALSPQSQDKLIREIRHELIMLPYYGVFDNLAFRLQGRTVILEGQVANSVLKP